MLNRLRFFLEQPLISNELLQFSSDSLSSSLIKVHILRRKRLQADSVSLQWIVVNLIEKYDVNSKQEKNGENEGE